MLETFDAKLLWRKLSTSGIHENRGFNEVLK